MCWNTWRCEVFVSEVVPHHRLILLWVEGHVHPKVPAALTSLQTRGKSRPHLDWRLGRHFGPVGIWNAPPSARERNGWKVRPGSLWLFRSYTQTHTNQTPVRNNQAHHPSHNDLTQLQTSVTCDGNNDDDNDENGSEYLFHSALSTANHHNCHHGNKWLTFSRKV